jgi:hypothetical protein
VQWNFITVINLLTALAIESPQDRGSTPFWQIDGKH